MRIEQRQPEGLPLSQSVGDVLTRDFARLQTTSANIDAFWGTFDDRTHSLNVGIKTTLSASVRVGDIVAETGSLTAYITDRCHSNHS